MAKVTYKQVHLVQPSTGKFETSWIPSEFAKAGKWLAIQSTDGEWVNGWQVKEVYGGTTLTAEEMIKRRENLQRFKWVLGE